MRGRLGWLVAVALAAVVGVAAWGTRSEAGTGPATIRITDRELQLARVDNGRRGTSPGDVEVIRTRLFNRRVTAQSIGRSELVCTYVDNRTSRVCRGVYVLPRGKLVVDGSVVFRQLYELAIVGGTGLYDNARGTLTVTRTGSGPVRQLLVFRLVG